MFDYAYHTVSYSTSVKMKKKNCESDFFLTLCNDVTKYNKVKIHVYVLHENENNFKHSRNEKKPHHNKYILYSLTEGI